MDSVAFWSIASVAGALIVFVYLIMKVIKLMNSTNSED